MRLHILLALLLLSLATPVPATAGSLDDFRGSVDRRNTQPTRRSPHPGPTTNARPAPLWWTYVVVGHQPGPDFSFGRGVYDGRGVTARGGDLSFMSVAENTRNRRAHLQLRLEGLISPNTSTDPAEARGNGLETPVGVGGFLKFETAAMPGIVLWHQRIMDFAASDRLGVTHVALDPRLYTGAHGQAFWTIGVPIYGSENGLLNAGALVGFGFDAAPVRPLVLHARLNVTVLSGAVLGDLYADAGVELAPGWQLVAGYRGLVSSSPLHLVTVGVMFDGGVGRR